MEQPKHCIVNLNLRARNAQAQLLCGKTRPCPDHDLLDIALRDAGRVTVLESQLAAVTAKLRHKDDWIGELSGQLAAANTELADLNRWKQEALVVDREWDAQAVANELNLKLGSSIRASIMPAITGLKSQLARALKDNSTEYVRGREDEQRARATVENSYIESLKSQLAAANEELAKFIHFGDQLTAERDNLRAEVERLKALIDKTGDYWLSLSPGIPWEGAIDEAMKAGVAEIIRLRAQLEEMKGNAKTAK
jgi:chromosome segregation ATPase